ncbi:MAG: translation initiation factor IF-3 [Bacteroidales bacterium]|nr:translation initiation factor IF-3 [Bacteroidales bacterium]MDT8429997.1 translation initiation factor IF-3 [Bacteroidales bacterium]
MARPGGRNYRRDRRPEPQHKVNERIRAATVRVVGENVENPGVYSLSEALKIADGLDMDLVEISPNADPPVCRVVDYQKFLYQQKKKQKEMKAKTTKIVVKEIRFGPNTDDHDYDFKMKHAQKFLEEGAKVKAFVFFKGRTILFKEKGEILLLKLAQDLEDIAKVEQLPKLEGKRMTMFLTPKVNTKK